MRTLTALTALSVLLLAAPAAAFTPDRAALMVDAVRANGCAMQGDDAEGTLAPLGLNGVEVQAFVDTLYGAGLVTLSDDMNTLSLSPELCAAEGDASLAMITTAFEAQESALEAWRPEFAPERGAAFIAVVRGADCTLTEEAAQVVLPEQGFTPEETRDIVSVLIDGQVAIVNGEGTAFALSDTLCAADPETDVATVAALLTAWDENHPAATTEPGADQ